jgi:hypothetical protein
MASKRHHQVPRLLLGTFATDGKVDMRLRSGELNEGVSLSSVAVQEHFYAYFDTEGIRNNEIETYLAVDVESPFAPVLRDLVAGGDVGNHPDLLARFVAWQIARTARFRSLDNLLAERLGPLLAGIDATSAWADGHDGDWSEEEAQQVFDGARAEPPAAYQVTGDVNTSLRVMMRFADRLEPSLLSARWCIAEADTDVFVLGDNPVELFRPGLVAGGFGGFGFNADTEIRMPLSPRHVLLGSNGLLSGSRILATRDLITSVNEGQARWCLRALFACPGSRTFRALDLAIQPEPLPEPTIRLSRSDGSNPTNLEFPPLNDQRVDVIVTRTQA